MTNHLYSLPAAETEIEDLLVPFLDDEVQEFGLKPGEKFLVLLFGEDASEQLEIVRDIIKDHSATAREAYVIDQLGVVSLDERRLNTFTTSLLYNLLEINRDIPLEQTLSRDIILGEDERKIDYYLPRLQERVSELTADQSERFQETLKELFPVALENEAAREMNDRLEKDIVTDQTIIDYLLLAAASTDDPSGVRNLVQFVRQEGIDESGLLSGGSHNVAGYQRVFSLTYHLTKDGFRSEFKTARSLYESGATNELFQLLNATDDPSIRRTDSATLDNIYAHESPVEQLLGNQFPGNTQKIAQRLLRVINGTRIIENHSDSVTDAYRESREDLTAAITDLKIEISTLEAHNDEFDTEKIIIEPSEPTPLETFVEKADDSNSLILQYLLGKSRSARTCVYETLKTRIQNRTEELESARQRLDAYLEILEDLERKRIACKEQLEEGYERIEDLSVDIELPSRDSLKQKLDDAWEERLVDLQHELPAIDLTRRSEDPDRRLDEWDSEIQSVRSDLDRMTDPLDDFEKLIDTLEQMQEEQEEIREMIDEIDTLLEVAE